MGAWDVGTFDNDTACDWAFELHGIEDLSVVRHAIEAVLVTGSDYLDADHACEALAACEVIARLKGKWGEQNAHTEALDKWVRTHPLTPAPELVQHALEAIDRIVGQPSELRELWDESPDAAKWHAAVAELRARVAGHGTSAS
ncbi:MAG: DUF4259 domain-containing protein [Myxococcales bacterium]|nr:DUF4259 domain-containing protein [Myxococcales bacterium]